MIPKTQVPQFQARFEGQQPYARGLELQQHVLEQLSSEAADSAVMGVVLGFEHDSVITLGVRGRENVDLTCSRALLKENGGDLVKVSRGGQATLHSPGQLVIYPCLRLRQLGLSPRCFVSKMQDLTAACLYEYGLDAEKGKAEPGLFVQGQKIAAFGFHISHGLTSHGLAVNIANDLNLFGLIRTCGVSDQQVTSMAQHGIEVELEVFFERWTLLLQKMLGERP